MPRRACLLAPLLFVVACGSPPPPHLDSPGTAVVCFGDSLTAGTGAPPDRGFPEQLAELLGVEVLNLGVPGETAADGLRRVDRLLAEDPWLVIVTLGGNDILRRVPIETTEEALRGLVETLLDHRVLPVLVEVYPPVGGGHHRALFRRLGTDYEIPVVRDAVPRILRDPALRSDPIHPNERGYAELARQVARTVAPLVKQREACDAEAQTFRVSSRKRL